MNFPEIADSEDIILRIMKNNLEILNYIPSHLNHNLRIIERVIQKLVKNLKILTFVSIFLMT